MKKSFLYKICIGTLSIVTIFLLAACSSQSVSRVTNAPEKSNSNTNVTIPGAPRANGPTSAPSSVKGPTNVPNSSM